MQRYRDKTVYRTDDTIKIFILIRCTIVTILYSFVHLHTINHNQKQKQT